MNESDTPTPAELIAVELGVLHRGRALHSPELHARTGPYLRALANLGSYQDLSLFRQSLTNHIVRLSDELAQDLRLAVLAGFAIEPQTRNMINFKDRVSWLASQLGYEYRTAQRRVRVAEALLAEEISRELLRRGHDSLGRSLNFKGFALEASDPRSVDEYVILRRLGQGAMGTVYLAQDADGRSVAIKVIKREFAADASFLRRFRAEAEHARKVEGAYTAPIIAAITDGELPYLVNEFIDGPTLDELVISQGPLPLWNAKALAIGTAAALIAIHDADVVHRDLKPSNIMLSQFGPQVIDFGIARSLSAVTRLTHTGLVVGTPVYMSPEQIQNERVTAASDVFSWGSIMVYATTGHPPFGDADTALLPLLFQILEGDPKIKDVPAELRDIVVSALEKDPETRPTAKQLHERLILGRKPATSRG